MAVDGKVTYKVDYDVADAKQSLTGLGTKITSIGKISGEVGSAMTKNITTPITNTVLFEVSPIIKNEPVNREIESKNISFGLFFFSPKIAAGPIAIKPKSIAGR